MGGLKKYYFGKKKNKIVNNLVAHFKLDGDVTDYVNGNNGSNVGSVSYVTGKLNQGCRYVASAYNSVPHSSNYVVNIAGQDLKYTINLWVALDAINATSYLVCRRSGGSIIYSHYCNVSGSNVTFSIFNNNASNGTNIQALSQSVSFTAGTFNMITFTGDGSELATGLKIYFNGVQLTTTPTTTGSYTGMLDSGSPPLLIGNELGSPGTRFTRGIIDEVSIWKNKELSLAEIAYLYNSGAGRAYPF